MLTIYTNNQQHTTYIKLTEKISQFDNVGILYLHLPFYDGIIDKIKLDYDVPYNDVISINEHTKNYKSLRDKFKREHYHKDFEMRYFTNGTATFSISINNTIFELIVEPNDLICIPPNVKHWFDAGDNPNFTAIRFFTDKNGWDAIYT